MADNMYWIGPLLGGSVLSSVSTAGSYILEKKAPVPKAVVRDFLLGAVLFLLIAQLLPESTSAFLGAILALISVSKTDAQESPPAQPSILETVSQVVSDTVATVAATEEDLQVKVGVPSF
jgi:hypothetical protein